MQSAADLIKMRQGRGRVKGEEEGVRETEDLTERTARLVATCTAAATAAVLTSSLKQVSTEGEGGCFALQNFSGVHVCGIV